MSLQRRKDIALLLSLIAACWPVWRWWLARVGDGMAWEAVSLITAIVFVTLAGRAQARKSPAPAMALLLCYSIAFPFVPPLLRACLAMLTIASLSSTLWLQRAMHWPLCGLLLLSLPVIESLNFYIGYPLRVIVGSMAQTLINMHGFAVLREGVALNFNGQLIAIDAPCSGVKMLWAGLYLACALAAFRSLSTLQTAVLLAASIFAVILGNVLRTVALFYVEAQVVTGPAWWHDAVGVAAFLGAATMVAIVGTRLLGRSYAR